MIKFAHKIAFGLIFISSLSAAATHSFRIIPFNGYFESSGLPPRLNVKYELKCSQEFVQVIRHDETDIAKGKAIIAVGILVREKASACNTSSKKTVEAGTTFSGREFEVVAIKGNNQEKSSPTWEVTGVY